MASSTPGFWFRYRECTHAGGVDIDGVPIPGDLGPMCLYLDVFEVTKRTAKGVRLDNGRFVRLAARKRWAAPTIEEALQSYKARKVAQIRILRTRLADALDAADLADAVRSKILHEGEAVAYLPGWRRRRALEAPGSLARIPIFREGFDPAAIVKSGV